MQTIIELSAVIAGAIYGILLARKHELDFVGVFSLALAVSFGGGTLRDLFLDRHPLFWIEQSHYPVIVFGLSLVCVMIPQLPDRIVNYLAIPDALGLGLFSVAGAAAAVESETSWFIAVLMGVITGTFGGVIGDVVCNRVPSLFRTAPMFATCSFAGTLLYLAMESTEITHPYAEGSAIAFIVVFRLLALRYQWTLPQASTTKRTD